MAFTTTTFRATSGRAFRRILPWALALAVATCTNDQNGPSAGGTGYFSFRPVYGISGSLSQFGIVADSVHVTLTRPVDRVVLDTTVFFPPDSTALRLALPVHLEQSPETLSAVIEIKAGGTLLFVDSVDVQVVDGPPSAASIPTVVLDYVGPGKNVAAITLDPADTTVVLGDTLFFSASAVDTSGVPVASFFVAWRSGDTTVAKINSAGRLIAPNARGSVRVIGSTPTGIADTTLVTFAPVPVIVTADSGNAQSGLVGDSLGALFVARVKGADSLGISGIAVRFASLTAGGAVRDTATLITDAQGRVRTRGRLGTAAGPYSYTATVVGTAVTRTFSATATAGAASAIAIQGGDAQSDSAGRLLPFPLTVRVADAFDNPVAGAKVYWTRPVGTGVRSADSSVSDAAGLASITYTLGAVGVDTIRATLAATGASIDFGETAINGAPATVQKSFGDAQADTVGRLLTDSLIVIVRSATAQPVAGTPVVWTVLRGGATSTDTVLTDPAGRAAVAYTLGTTPGTDSVQARAGGASAVFTESALTGLATTLALVSGDAQTDTTGKPLPLPLVVRATDAFGNTVAGTAIAWSRTSGTGTLAADTVLTDGAGLASNAYTLGGSAGTDSITATLVCGCSTVTFTASAVSAAPASIVTVQGDSQTVTASAVADTFAVLVRDGASNPIAGVKVDWAFIPAQGNFTPLLPAGVLSSFTDSLGVARGIYTAGTQAGTVRVEAQVGTIIDSIYVFAVPAAPTIIAIVSGDGQTDTTGRTLPLPFVVGVTDAFGNPVASAKVAFQVIAGNGSASSDTVLTDLAGQAQVNFTLGASPAADTIRASLVGTSAFVDFSATGVSGAPAGLIKLLGDNQADTVLSTLADSLVVQLLDAGSTPIPNAWLYWTTAGMTLSADSTRTDVNGRAAVQAMFGSIAVPAVVVVHNADTTLAAAFNLRMKAGRATQITAVAGVGQTGAVSTPLPLDFGAFVQDAYGNHADSGVAVQWSNIAGFGAGLPDTTLTDTTGVAFLSAPLLGPIAGEDSLQAQILGAADTALFTATATAGAAASLVYVSGTGQSQTVGTPLAQQFTVEARDGASNPVAGTWVRWTVTAGGGSFPVDSVLTDGSGVAKITLTVGTAAGLDSAIATMAGSTDTVAFYALATADVPAALVKVSGDSQSSTESTNLPLPMVVQVTDQYGNPLAGITVDFGVVSGPGLGFATPSPVTDAAGLASSGTVNLLAGSGTTTVDASTAAIPADTVLFTVLTLPLGTSKQWNGTVSSSWADPANWSPAGLPSASDNVFVPAGAPNQPVLDLSRTIGGLTVETGADVNVQGNILTLNGSLIADGTITRSSGHTILAGSTVTARGNLGAIQSTGSVTLDGASTVESNLQVTAGTFNVGGQTLTLNGALDVSGGGAFRMNSATDSVDISGGATFAGSTTTGLLTAGVLVLRGDLSETSGSATFRASGTHRTVFAGAATQVVTFNAPGLGSDQFQDVAFANPAGVVLNTGFAVAGIADIGTPVNGPGMDIRVGGGIIDEGSPDLNVGFLTLEGSPSVLPDTIPGWVTVTGNVALADHLAILGQVTVSSGSLDPNGHTLTIGNGLNATSSGALVMQNALDSVDVSGTTHFDGSTTTGLLTDGVLVVRGAFLETSGSATFRASGNHTTVFAGGAAQTIQMVGAGIGADQFQNVVFATAGGVVLNSDIAAGGNGAVTAGTLTGTGRTAIIGGDLSDPTGVAWAPEFTRLTGSPLALPDSFTQNLEVTGAVTLPHNVAVHGTLAHTGGSLILGGFTLRVDSTLTVSGAAALRMQSASDSLIVGGSTSWAGSTSTGFLTAGTAVFRGNFSELSGSATYRASAGHTTVFAGTAPQTVSFVSPGLGNDQFQNVEFANPTTVTLLSGFAAAGNASITSGALLGAGQTGTVGGDLADATGSAWRMDTTDLAGTTTALPLALARTLKVSGSVTLSNDVAVHGNLLHTNGNLILNGHTLTVDSALDVSGAAQFRMQSPGDSLDVAGATTWAGSTSTGLLTTGTAVFRGDFSELSGSSTYRASGAHRTVFAGTTAQNLSFVSPAPGGDQFQFVTFANPAGVTTTDFAVAGDAVVTDGPVAGPGTATLAGTVTDTANGLWRPELTLFTAAPSALPDSFARSVSLTGTVTLFKPLVVGGQLTVAGGLFTPNGFFVRADSGLSVTGSAQFVMGNAADSVDVTGTALWNGSTTGGLLTNGVLVLHGDLSAPSGVPTFQPSGAHRTRFTTGLHTVAFPGSSGFAGNRFQELEVTNASNVTTASDLYVAGTFRNIAGPTGNLIGSGAQRLITRGLAVNNWNFDGIRVEYHGPASFQLDNANFVNQDPTLIQLDLRTAGGATVTLNSASFATPPTTGRYIAATDTAANGQPVAIAMFHSFPLDGSAFEQQVAGNDGVTIDWSTLVFADQPLDIVAGGTLAAVRVALLNPAGDTAAFFTDNVTLAIGTNPASGTLGGTTTQAAVGGIATFGDLTIDNAGLGYTLDASVAGFAPLGSAPFNVTVPLPAGFNAQWTGATSADWFDPTNWSTGTVPDSTTNVFISGVGSNDPAITVDSGFVKRLRLAPGATITLAPATKLTADSSVEAAGSFAGAGVLELRGTGTLSGTVGLQTNVDGTYGLTGAATVATMTIEGAGTLDVAADTLTIQNALNIGFTGVLSMTNAAGLVDVGGNANFSGGSTVGNLTAGTLRLSGDLLASGATPTTAFAPSAGHLTILNGTGTQTVNLVSPDSVSGSHFGRLQVSTAGVAFMLGRYDALGDLLITNGATLADSLVVGFEAHGFTTLDAGGTLDVNNFRTRGGIGVAVGATYSVATTTYYGGGAFPINPAPYDTLVLQLDGQATGDFVVTGDLRVTGSGAGFDPNGHTVAVGGSVDINNGGVLKMTNAADVLNVAGSFFTNGGTTTGLLTNGLLQLGGGFRQAADGSGESFRASGSHTTRFTGGTGRRQITFDSPSVGATDLGGSHFAILDLPDGVDSLGGRVPAAVSVSVGGAVTFDSTGSGYELASYGPLSILASSDSVHVQTLETWGGLSRAGTGLYRAGLTRLYGGSGTLPSLPYTDLAIAYTAYTLGADQVIPGNLQLGILAGEIGPPAATGELTVGGHTLTVGADLGVLGLGQLTMGAGDSVDVTGAMTWRGAPNSGHLTGGTLVARGLFNMVGTDAFQADAAHRTVMLNPGMDDIYTVSNSWFGKLYLLGGERRIRSPSPLVVLDSLVLGSSTAALTDTSFGANNGQLVTHGPVFTAFSSALRLGGSMQIDVNAPQIFGSYAVGTTVLGGTGQVVPNLTYNNGNIRVIGTAQVNAPLDLGTGSFTVDGSAGAADFDLNGQLLQVQDFTTTGSGTLTSTTAGSELLVRGAASFEGGDETGRLTTGRLTVNGDFTTGTVTPGVFVASGTHVTVFNGASPQSITFGPGLPRGAFNDVVTYNGFLAMPYGLVANGTFRDSVTTGTLTLTGNNNELNAARVEMTGVQVNDLPIAMGEGSQFDTAAFTFADPSTVTQILVTGAGSAAPLDLHAITFDSWLGAPQLVRTVDTLTNGQGVQVRMFGSTPFDGSSATFLFDPADPGLSSVTWSHLALDAPLPATVDSAVPFSISVVVKEPDGSNRSNVVGTAQLSLATNPGNATLSVGSNATFDGQVGTFNGVILDGASAGVSFHIEMQNRLIDSFTTGTLDVINPAPAGAVIFDGGASDGLWTSALNWSTDAMPASTDSVFIPAGTSVTFTGTDTVGTLVLGSGASLNVASGTLISTGNVYAGQTITGFGTLQMAGGAAQLSGTIGNLTVTGSVTAVGRTTVTGDLVIDGTGDGAEFNLGGQKVDVSNTLFTQSGGLLTMDGAADTLLVASVSFAGGDETGRLTDGVLVIQGSNFDQGFGDVNSFHATGNHTTIFGNGGSATAVNISDPASSQFANVKVQNPNEVGFNESGLGLVRIVGDLTISAGGVATGDTLVVGGAVTLVAPGDSIALVRLRVNGAITAAGGYNVPLTELAGTGQSVSGVPGGYQAVSVLGSVALGGPVLARSLTVAVGGSLDVNGRALTVDSLFTNAGVGDLLMDNAADTVIVNTLAQFTGTTPATPLTAGLLEIRGDLNVSPNYNAFVATAGHVTRFAGAPVHAMNFPGEGNSTPLGTVVIDSGTVLINDNVLITGDLVLHDGHLADSTLAVLVDVNGSVVTDNGPSTELQMGTLQLGGALTYNGNGLKYQPSTTRFAGTGQVIPQLPYQFVQVTGTASLAGDAAFSGGSVMGNGVLTLGGHSLSVSGMGFLVTDNAHLIMQDAGDTLSVNGTATFQGANSTGDYTAGAIKAVNFVQQQGPSSDPFGFVESGSHRLIPLLGGGSITMNNAGPGGSVLKTIDFSTAGALVTVQGLWVTDTILLNDAATTVQAADGYPFHAGGAFTLGAGTITAARLGLGGTIAYLGGTYAVDTTVFAGAGQVIPNTVPYRDIVVQYAATLGGDLTLLNRNVRVENSGALDLAGNTLDLSGPGGNGSFRTSGPGVLMMQNDADTLIAQSVEFRGGNTTGLLTAGLIRTAVFTQAPDYDTRSFAASGTHAVELVTIGLLPESPYPTYIYGEMSDTTSHFNTVRFLSTVGDAPTGDVYALDTVFINNTLQGSGRTITAGGPAVIGNGAAVTLDTLRVLNTLFIDPSATLNIQNTVFGPAAAPIPGAVTYNTVIIEGAQTLTAPLTTSGDIYVRQSGVLTPTGNLVSSLGTLHLQDDAHLVMAAADTVDAGGATFDGAASGGDLTGGLLRLTGSFAQSSTTSAASFAPTGMDVEFIGGGVHAVSFATPGSAVSHFAALSILDGGTLQPTTGLVATGTTTIDTSSTFDAQLLNGAHSALFTGKVRLLDLASVQSPSNNLLDFRDSLIVAPTASYSAFNTAFQGTDGIPDVTYTHLYLRQGVHLTLTHPLFALGSLNFQNDSGTGNLADTVRLRLNGHRVAVNALGITGHARITMDSIADTLYVGGPATFHGLDQDTAFSAGVIQIGGNLTQVGGYSSHSFAPTGTRTEFIGAGNHNIDFANPGVSLSHLRDLAVTGTATFTSTASVLGDVTVNNGATLTAGNNGAQVYFFGKVNALGSGAITNPTLGLFTFNDSLIVATPANYNVVNTAFQATNAVPVLPYTNLYLYEGVHDTLTTDLTVNGTLSLSASTVGGQDLVLNGNTVNALTFTTQNEGRLTMANALDSLIVAQNATFDGGDLTGLLTAGALSIGGDFYQTGAVPLGFVADSGHTTRFFGTGTHQAYFSTPSPAGGGGSHFGSLEFAPDASLVLNLMSDIWAEGKLTTTGNSTPTLQNGTVPLRTLTAQDVSIQGIVFDHVQFHLAKTTGVAAGAGAMSSVTFQNFLTNEDQFLVDLPGESTQYAWGGFTFTQLNTGDTGRYMVASDTDGATPNVLTISLGTNNWGVTDPPFYVGLNGALIFPFAP